MRRSLNEAEQKLQPQREQKARPEATRAIRVGDTVELLKLGTKASVLAINKDGSYQLQRRDHAGDGEARRGVSA